MTEGKSGFSDGLKPLFPLFLLVLSSLFALWPLGFSSHPHDHVDTLFNTWLVSWNSHAVLNGENPLSQPIFQGFPDGNGRSDLLLTQSMAAIPLQLAGVPPVTVHNLLLVLSLALAGYSTLLLARYLNAGNGEALFAGIAVTLLPWFQSHVWHLQLFSGGLGILAILHGMKIAGGGNRGWLMALFILLQCLASLYLWYFTCLALLLLLPFVPVKRIPRYFLWFLAGNLVCLPFLSGQLANAESFPVDAAASADILTFVAPWENSVLMGWARAGGIHPEAALWPGLAITSGFILYLFRGRREPMDRYLLLCVVFFSLISLGPTLVVAGKGIAPAPFRLLAVLPGASSIRLPARGAFFSLVPMAILAARMLRCKPLFLPAGIIVAAAGVFHAPIETIPVPDQPWHSWLEERNFDSVLYLPVSDDLHRPETETLRLFGSIGHFTPSLNGYSTSLPADYSAATAILNTWPSPEAQSSAIDLGVQCVIVEDRSIMEDADTVFMRDHGTVSILLIGEESIP